MEGVLEDNYVADGTTAFDIALGHGDDRALNMLLESPCVEPKDHMLRLIGKADNDGQCSDEIRQVTPPFMLIRRDYGLPSFTEAFNSLRNC